MQSPNGLLQYYTFKNIRFAAPPVGDLRWAKPAPPLTETKVQDGKVGNQCMQATPPQFFGTIPGIRSNCLCALGLIVLL